MSVRWLLVLALGCSKAPADPPASQCTRDDECGLLPSALSCCEECPPAPPFEAAPTWMIDGALVEHETACGDNRRGCPALQCERVPAGCHARAACVNGQCTPVTTGCERPTS